MPPRMSDTGPRVGGEELSVFRHRSRALDYQPSGGVIEAKKVQLVSRRGAEDVGEGHSAGVEKLEIPGA